MHTPSPTTTTTASRRRLAMLPVAALVLAACGGDDDADGSDAADAAALPAPAGDEPAADPGDDAGDDAGGGAVDDAGGDDDDGAATDPPPATPASGPATLMSALDPIDLPDPGTARVVLAGETYEFEFAAFEFAVCEVSNPFGDLEDAQQFRAVALGETADGHETRLEIIRRVDLTDGFRIFGDHEWEFLQLSVSQEPGGEMYSNAIADGSRPEIGGPVRGDFEELPVIKVAEVDGRLAATAIAEVSHPPFTREFDRTGEGLAEFALVCP